MLKSDKGIKRMSDYMEKVSEEAAKAWMEEGRQEGLRQGKTELLISEYKDGIVTAEQAAKWLSISVKEFLKLAEK